MTIERTDPAPAPDPSPTHPEVTAGDRAVSALRDICPFLLAADGGWRSAEATGQHRCTAVFPPAPLAPEKQRRLCLTPDHESCATFVAALSAREPKSPDAHHADTRPMPRTTPVIMERARFAIPMPSLRPDRTAGQAALVILLAVAFVGIVASRPGGSAGAPGGVADPSGSPAIASPVTSPAASVGVVEPSASPVEASPTPGITLVPTENTPPPSTSPAAASTYTVKRGDTLSGIASVYGTTWQVLAELNDIENPSALRVGTVLELP